MTFDYTSQRLRAIADLLALIDAQRVDHPEYMEKEEHRIIGMELDRMVEAGIAEGDQI